MNKRAAGLPEHFPQLLNEVKDRIQQAQTRAVLAVNSELVRLYWDIGRLIDARQQREGWGAGVIPRLASALRNEVPEVKGFSERNIKRMLAFYRAYGDQAAILRQPLGQLESREKVPQAAAQLPDSLLWSVPWFHHILLIEKVKDVDARAWYIQQTLANGWSRNVLLTMIQSQAHCRQGQSLSNFERLLPSPQSDLARQLLKDPYVGQFKPEYAGKMNFYLGVVDDRLRHSSDAASIGLILCQDHNQIVVEYALRGLNKPIGVSEYELTRALPASLKSSLPAVEEIEAELAHSASAGSAETLVPAAPKKRKAAGPSKPAKKMPAKRGRKKMK